MNQTVRELTIERAAQIQLDQLKNWKKKLVPECFNALADWCIQQASKLDVNSTGYDIPRGDDLTRFVQNWTPEKQCPKMADRGQAMWEIVEALRYFSPSVIYEIAKEALVGAYDPFDVEETLCSDQIFLECWKIEKTNNGPWAFLRAMGDEYADRALSLLRGQDL